MIKTITSQMLSKLEEIGFEEDEISTIQIIHELKTREYQIDIRKLINQVAFENLSKGISEIFTRNNWSEEDFFKVVENHRNEKKK